MTTLSATPSATTTTWNIDPAHSAAEFKVKHMMISNVKGHFTKVTGTLTLDESDVTKSHVEALIEAASIESRDPQRDAHLKSADFFDVEKFPTLSFQSMRVSRIRDGELSGEESRRLGVVFRGLYRCPGSIGHCSRIGALSGGIRLPGEDSALLGGIRPAALVPPFRSGRHRVGLLPEFQADIGVLFRRSPQLQIQTPLRLRFQRDAARVGIQQEGIEHDVVLDRKSTRLNS